MSFAVSYYKVRGRGAGAPERQTGADGIFEIAVRRSDGRLIRAKGLPFQAKKNWRQRDRDLQQQASQMLQTLGTGLVIDYSTKGYAACKAEDAVELQGDRSSISRARRIRPLNQTLGNDFVNCDIGRVGLYYDPEREIFVSEEEAFQAIEGQLHVVDAKVLKPF